jgi:hypothetical protein
MSLLNNGGTAKQKLLPSRPEVGVAAHRQVRQAESRNWTPRTTGPKFSGANVKFSQFYYFNEGIRRRRIDSRRERQYVLVPM